MHIFYTASPNHILYWHAYFFHPHGLCVYARMGLMPGHGGRTVVKDNQGEFVIIVDRIDQTGNPGMATAGSGDVLGGVITGLMAQHHPRYPLEKILQAAVFIHGFAADLAAADLHPVTLTAKDLVDYLPPAFRRIHEFKSIFQFS